MGRLDILSLSQRTEFQTQKKVGCFTLVLSRKRDERIIIQCGDQTIELTVVEIRADKCRIGFDADRSVVIHRQEVYDKIKAAESQAAAGAGESAPEPAST